MSIAKGEHHLNMIVFMSGVYEELTLSATRRVQTGMLVNRYGGLDVGHTSKEWRNTRNIQAEIEK